MRAKSTAAAFVAMAVSMAAALTLASGAAATTGTVAKPLNVCTDASRCYTSIQAAIDAADDGDTVKVAAGIYLGNLAISKNISLVGAGSSLTTISVARPEVCCIRYRTMLIETGATVTVRGVTVTHIYGSVSGGGILNRGALTLRETNITKNGEGGCGTSCEGPGQTWPADNPRQGGGIFTSGPLTVVNSTVDFNAGERRGGGIYNDGAAVKLFDSTVSHNAALTFVGSGNAGGIWNGGTMTLYDSDISDNRASASLIGGGSGGGIVNAPLATLVLRSSTVTGNTTAGFGGGISNDGTLSLYDTTITGNTAIGYQAGMNFPYPGGGILNSGAMNVFDSVISGNAPNDCSVPSSSPPYYVDCPL
jgi:hypothetical protein